MDPTELVPRLVKFLRSIGLSEAQIATAAGIECNGLGLGIDDPPDFPGGGMPKPGGGMTPLRQAKDTRALAMDLARQVQVDGPIHRYRPGVGYVPDGSHGAAAAMDNSGLLRRFPDIAKIKVC